MKVGIKRSKRNRVDYVVQQSPGLLQKLKWWKGRHWEQYLKLTNVYIGLFIFLPTMFIWEEKNKIWKRHD